MEIIVLSTLHQWHGKVNYYTYEHLSEIIEHLSPDVLAVELTPTAVERREPQRIKQEYQHSVYPLMDKMGLEVLPLEPSEPKYSELAQLGQSAQETLAKHNPSALEQFGIYVQALYEVLFDWWASPLDVNSAETDRHFAIKHKSKTRFLEKMKNADGNFGTNIF